MNTSKHRPVPLTRLIAPAVLATALIFTPISSDGQSCCGSGSGGGGGLSLGAGPRVIQMHLKAPLVPQRLLVADVTHGKILYNKLVAHGAGQTQISVRLKVPKDAIIKVRYVDPSVTGAVGSNLPSELAYLTSSAGTMRNTRNVGNDGQGNDGQGSPVSNPSNTSTDQGSVPEGTICDDPSGSASGEEDLFK